MCCGTLSLGKLGTQNQYIILYNIIQYIVHYFVQYYRIVKQYHSLLTAELKLYDKTFSNFDTADRGPVSCRKPAIITFIDSDF